MKSKKTKTKRTKRNNKYQLDNQRNYSNYENFKLTFLDPHKYVVLKYVDVYSQSLATVTGSNQIMNLNSIFDPDRTGTGHQPYGRDQLAAIYNRYRVLKTQWRITFHAELQGFYIVVVPTNGNLSTPIVDILSYTAACETPRATIRAQGTGANAVVIRGQIDLNDLNGVTKVEYLSDDRFQAVMTSSPGELLLLNIGTYNPSGSTVTVDFSVELEFFVDVHDPIVLAQS